MQDSPLGEIPVGWRVGKLEELCNTQYGYTASAIEETVGPHLLRVTDINKQNWIEWDKVPYCEIADEDVTKYRLQVGDLVVARMADPGKSAIIEQPIDAVFASYLVCLKTESLAHAYFVYGFLKSQAYADYSEGAMGGSSVQKSMNAKVIVDVNLVIPPVQVLETFLKYVLPLRQRLVANVEQSATLASIRDTLLPKLLSGEIRVKDAEKFVEKA
jgi:type I restriction enzyme S subunit